MTTIVVVAGRSISVLLVDTNTLNAGEYISSEASASRLMSNHLNMRLSWIKSLSHLHEKDFSVLLHGSQEEAERRMLSIIFI